MSCFRMLMDHGPARVLDHLDFDVFGDEMDVQSDLLNMIRGMDDICFIYQSFNRKHN